MQRDNYFRQKYATDVSEYQPEMLVFLNETGADHRNSVRQLGEVFNKTTYDVCIRKAYICYSYYVYQYKRDP